MLADEVVGRRRASAEAGGVIPEPEAPDRVVEYPLRLGTRLPAADFTGLVRLQLLVDVEEMSDLRALVHRDVLQILDRLPPDIGGRDAEQLGMGPTLVAHPEDRAGPSRDLAAGKRRLPGQDQCVEWIAVLRQRARHVAVVGRIAGRG